jgi:hypothetical protein
MKAHNKNEIKICPFPPERKQTPSPFALMVIRIRTQITQLLSKKASSIIILFGGILILAAQIWVILILSQFLFMWGWAPDLVGQVQTPMLFVIGFGFLASAMVLLSAIITYFKNVKFGTAFAIFWALLANLMLIFVLLIRTDIPEYVFFFHFWQTLSLGAIGACLGVLGGGLGLASLRKPYPVPPDVTYASHQLKTAGWAFTLLGGIVLLLTQIFLIIGFVIYNPPYLYEMSEHFVFGLRLAVFTLVIALCFSIGVIIAAFITSSINVKLGAILAFIFALFSFLPLLHPVLLSVTLIGTQTAGAAYTSAGGILSLASIFKPYNGITVREP